MSIETDLSNSLRKIEELRFEESLKAIREDPCNEQAIKEYEEKDVSCRGVDSNVLADFGAEQAKFHLLCEEMDEKNVMYNASDAWNAVQAARRQIRLLRKERQSSKRQRECGVGESKEVRIIPSASFLPD